AQASGRPTGLLCPRPQAAGPAARGMRTAGSGGPPAAVQPLPGVQPAVAAGGAADGGGPSAAGCAALLRRLLDLRGVSAGVLEGFALAQHARPAGTRAQRSSGE